MPMRQQGTHTDNKVEDLAKADLVILPQRPAPDEPDLRQRHAAPCAGRDSKTRTIRDGQSEDGEALLEGTSIFKSPSITFY